MRNVTTNKSPMRNPFSGSSPIYTLIDEYAEWKFGIHPYQAGAYRSLLIRFAKSHRIRHVEEITEEHIAYFTGGEVTGFFSMQALKAMRSFLWYANQAGYDCLSYAIVAKIKPQEVVEGESRSERLHAPQWIPGMVGKWKRN